MNHRERLGNMIADIRQSKGITQEQLAELSGLSRVNISKIENGRYNVSIDILQKICDAFGVELNFAKKTYIMNIENRLKKLADGQQCVIQKEIYISDEATLYHFICGSIESSCISYNDGTLFYQYDWQSGRPESIDGIADFDWLSENGKRAVILNGLPRIFA